MRIAIGGIAWLAMAGGLLAAPALDASQRRAHNQPASAPLLLDQPVSDRGEVQRAAEEGIAAFVKDDLDRARKAFEKLLKLAPDNLTGLVNLGLVRYRLNHPDDAAKLLKKALRLNPDLGPAWLALGLCQQRLGQDASALASLAQSVALDPTSARAHSTLAVTLVAKGWMTGAELELQRAIELDPDFGEAHFNLALVCLQRSPPAIELARRHYRRAIELGQQPDPAIEKKLDAAR